MMNSQAKEKYEIAFTRDKARYKEEMMNYQPSQQFLEMKAKQAQFKKEDDMKTVGTENENYFSVLLSSCRKCSGENPGFGAKEVQEMMWMQWTWGKVGVAKEK